MKAHNTYFMDCHLAGRKYHDADLVWEQLHIGTQLRMERETTNPYDPNAIQIIFNNDGEDFLLGYIPRTDNQQLAALLDAGWDKIFDCRISKLNPETNPEQQVQLTIRIMRNNKEESRQRTNKSRR
ncbi:MAG: HIRAN domain-containing protein [Bacteroidales bacterium]|nr:HIRAN domain-containing protein [Bacteroidales bacterium]